MKEVPWPANCQVVSLRQGQHLIIPQGDTVRRAGSILVVVVVWDLDEQVRKICRCEEIPETA